MRFFLIFIFVFTYIVSLLAVPEKYCIVEQSNSDYIILQFDFPELNIPESKLSSQIINLEVPGLTFNYEENKPLLPMFFSSFVAPSGKISWEILSKKSIALRLKFYPRKKKKKGSCRV